MSATDDWIQVSPPAAPTRKRRAATTPKCDAPAGEVVAAATAAAPSATPAAATAAVAAAAAEATPSTDALLLAATPQYRTVALNGATSFELVVDVNIHAPERLQAATEQKRRPPVGHTGAA